MLALLLPVATAVICYFSRDPALRKVLIIMIAATLGISAYWLHINIVLEPVFLSLPGLETLIAFLDFLMLFYFLYIGIERGHKPLIILAALQLLPLAYLELFLRPDLSNIGSFMIDRLSVVLYLVIAVVGSLVCIYAIQYMEEHAEQVDTNRNNRFFFWFVLFLAAMNGLVFSNNLLWLYFFWEVTTLCSFQLIGHDNTEPARNNALRALVMNSLGGVAMVGGIVILGAGFTGNALSLVDIVDSKLGLVSPLFLLVLGLFMAAAFTKAAQFPFQSWLLGAMVAPTPVSALLHSSTMVKAGVYLAIRLAPAYDGTILSTFVAVYGAFTFFAASLMAVGNDNAKEVLAYSTVANLGLITACCGINLPVALNAAVLLIVFHAISKALLFMGTGVIEHRLGSRNIDNMEGLGEKLPALAWLMAVGAFTMFLPPFGMLFSKWAAMASAAISPVVLVLFIAASALTTVFWVKWLGRMLSSPPSRMDPGKLESARGKLSGYYAVPLGMLGVSAVLLSLAVVYVIDRLAAPAVLLWYPLAFQAVSNLDVALFSWASFFNPNVGSGFFPEGLFPTGFLFGALAATLVMLGLAFRRPDSRRTAPVYLCGENVPGDESHRFVTAMEQGAEVVLGGYYFTGFINHRLAGWLNGIAIVLLVVMIGVIIL